MIQLLEYGIFFRIWNGLADRNYYRLRVLNAELDTFESVSYTHLDVYKRQCKKRARTNYFSPYVQ